MLKFLVSAGAAVALATAPAVATAQSAPPPQARAGEVRPAAEEPEGSELRRGFILPLVGVVAVLLLAWLLTRDNGTDAVPLSP